MSVRILSTSPLVGDALRELGNTFPELLVTSFRSLEWKTALESAEAIVVMLSEPITESDIQAAPNLKAIGTYSVGVNHLPVSMCETRGITILNTPGVLTDSTADIALALLLSVTRRITEGESLVRSGAWSGWAPDQLLGHSLSGDFCGILGSGPIGKAFAKRVWALGMKPIFWDRERCGGVVDFGPEPAPRWALNDLLRQSAVVSLHCPLTEATRGLLDRNALQRLPRGAVVINTARGGILDEEAAMELLDSGHLGGVGLDVYAGEPALNPNWRRAPRTVLLPHLGSATLETRTAMSRLLCDGIAKAIHTFG